MKPLPKLVKKPIPRFYVDGDPFLILGLQWDCNTCHTPIEMVPLFKEAARLGCNTAVTPLYWYSIEPEPGEYDFTTVDLRLQACREAGLRLILLWFASYKNAGCYYAPKDIREDNRR
ncbi:MAG: beta-galactosidase, partial [Limnochordia bacterium]